MRICLVSPYSWSFPGGVVEHTAAAARHLGYRGHEVWIAAPNDPLDQRTRLLHPKLGRHGRLPENVIPLGRSVPLPSNGSLANVAFSPEVFRAADRAIASIEPDVVHVHEPFLPLVSWAAIKAARERDIPVAGTFHAYYPEGCAHYRLWGWAARRFLAPDLDAWIAVSPAAARTAGRYFPGEYLVIPNGVDLGRFRSSGLRREPGRVLFVGRPEERKGLPALLEAFSSVVEEVPYARLVIVGSRPDDVRVPKRLLGSVEVRGMVDEEEMVGCMHSSSILCAPSTGGESFGMVLTEAMAAGLPVVASDIPGYDAVVSSGENGLLVPPGDPKALAAALSSLLRDPDRREQLSLAGEISAARYDWSRIAATLEKVYSRLTQGLPPLAENRPLPEEPPILRASDVKPRTQKGQKGSKNIGKSKASR